MPFGLGKKDEVPFNTDITDKDELNEIKKIAQRLDSDEKVLVVATQSRIKPGGSKLTPSTIFATDRRLVLRDPSSLGLRESVEDIPYDKLTSARVQKGMLSSKIILRAPGFSTLSEKKHDMIDFKKGTEEGEIDAIPKDKAEKIIEAINQGLQIAKTLQHGTTIVNQQVSVSDELTKIAKLKEQGVITDAEFQQMKQELIKKLY